MEARLRHDFNVGIEGLEVQPEAVERIARAVQKAVLTELASMDIAPRLSVRFIGEGGTQGIQLTAEQAEG